LFSRLSPENGVVLGLFIQAYPDADEVVVEVSRRETIEQFPVKIVSRSAVYLTEVDATAAYAAWLFKRGEEIAAELHENEKKFWVAKQRVHDLKNGAPEREVRS
jgi:hypothetical protein